MSEQGWREFLAAEGVDDWVVLHGGATAVFRVPSLGEAARLAEAVAQVPGLEGAGVLMTIADDRLTVRLTRGVWRLEERHVDLARAVSAVARAARRRRRPRRVHRRSSSRSRRSPTRSMSASGGRSSATRRLADDNAVDPLGHGSTVWMQELDAAKPLRHAMHVDVSVAREHVEARLAAALAAGGRIVDDSDAPAPGSSPTAPATASASPPGPTVPPALVPAPGVEVRARSCAEVTQRLRLWRECAAAASWTPPAGSVPPAARRRCR